MSQYIGGITFGHLPGGVRAVARELTHVRTVRVYPRVSESIGTHCGHLRSIWDQRKDRPQVENEPGDYWFPCVLHRGAPRSVLVSIDGGAPEPFASISARQLAEFAMIAVFGGRVVVAYTKAFANARASASR